MGNLLSKTENAGKEREGCSYLPVVVACGGLALAFYGARMSVLRGGESLVTSSALLGAGIGVACLGVEKQVDKAPVHIKELILEALHASLIGKLSLEV